MHSSAEVLEPVVEDPLDTAGAASVEAARDAPPGVEAGPDLAAHEQPGVEGGVDEERSADDWQEGEHSASTPLEEGVSAGVSSSQDDSVSVPLAARHGQHGGEAAGSAGRVRQSGRRQTPQRAKGGGAEQRTGGAAGGVLPF